MLTTFNGVFYILPLMIYQYPVEKSTADCSLSPTVSWNSILRIECCSFLSSKKHYILVSKQVNFSLIQPTNWHPEGFWLHPVEHWPALVKLNSHSSASLETGLSEWLHECLSTNRNATIAEFHQGSLVGDPWILCNPWKRWLKKELLFTTLIRQCSTNRFPFKI